MSTAEIPYDGRKGLICDKCHAPETAHERVRQCQSCDLDYCALHFDSHECIEWCGCPDCTEEANGAGILCEFCSQSGCSTNAAACGEEYDDD